VGSYVPLTSCFRVLPIVRFSGSRWSNRVIATWVTFPYVVEIVEALSAAGIRLWSIGRWGCDALFGEETRKHPDLGVIVPVTEAQQAMQTPEALCFPVYCRFTSRWLNLGIQMVDLVERWFAELTNKKLRRGAHRSVRQLNHDIRAWIETSNQNRKQFVWTKTANQILDSIARYCARTNDSGH
jgi:hypothetical protein